MKLELSQQTLGLVRRILEEMEPEDSKSRVEAKKFWKDALFDFGFAPAVIGVLATYDFRWGDIIPDAFAGRLGHQNSHFSNALAPSFCEDILKRLVAFLLFHTRGTPRRDELRRFLAEDGFNIQPDAGNKMPASADVQNKSNAQTGGHKIEMPSSKPSILVLISHSSKDAEFASAVIDLLRAGLGLLAKQIRCTSVDGYRLPAGVNTDAQLRREIADARVLVGLLTPNSLSSTYVLFELGARWGTEQFMIPLLAGVKPEEMRGPHSVFNALSCSSEAQLIQFIEDMGRELKTEAQSSSSYLDKVRTVKRLSDAVEIESPGPPSPKAPQKRPEPNLVLIPGVKMGKLYLVGDHWYRTPLSGYARPDEHAALWIEIKNRADDRIVGSVSGVRAELIIGEDEYSPLFWLDQEYNLVEFEFGESNYVLLAVEMGDGDRGKGDWRIPINRRDYDHPSGLNALDSDNFVKVTMKDARTRLNLLHVSGGTVLRSYHGKADWRQGRPWFEFN